MSILPQNKSKIKKLALLCGILLIVAGIASSSSFVASFASKSWQFVSAIYASVLIDLTNQERDAEKIDGLIVSPILTEAANLKAQDMASKGYFAHTSPEGKTPWYWFDQVGYKYSYAGENLAVDFTESADVDKAWMNSPLHRANIVNKNFKEIGIGMAEGIYEGRVTTFVVQLFGTEALSKPAVKTTPKNNPNISTPVVKSNASIPPEELALDTRVLGSETSKLSTFKNFFLSLFSFTR